MISHYEKDHIDSINQEIKDYQQKADRVSTLIKYTENKRTQILNHIEKLVDDNLLDKRTAHRLEDKLIRPYSIDLLNI